jgi:hypothetical protein
MTSPSWGNARGSGKKVWARPGASLPGREESNFRRVEGRRAGVGEADDDVITTGDAPGVRREGFGAAGHIRPVRISEESRRNLGGVEGRRARASEADDDVITVGGTPECGKRFRRGRERRSGRYRRSRFMRSSFGGAEGRRARVGEVR